MKNNRIFVRRAGAGRRGFRTDRGGDLVAIFPAVEIDSPVVEILGREKTTSFLH